MFKEKRILSYFIGWLILGLFICFIGISKTNALVIDSKFLGYANNGNFGISAGNYISGSSYITVDQANALNYYVVDMCTTLNNLFTITNISNQSGNVSLYKTYSYLGSCNTDNFTGQLARIYFKINQWADAGNGNFGIIFSSRLNNTSNYYGDNKIINIYTTNEIDETSELLNNQTNELNNSIGNAENNINSNINDMEQSIINNQNENNEKIIEELKKGQLTCGYKYKEIINYKNLPSDNGVIASDGITINQNTSFRHSDYIPIFGGYIYNVSGYNDNSSSSNFRLFLYDENYNYIKKYDYKTQNVIDLTTYEGLLFYRINVNKEENNSIMITESEGNICVPTSYLQMKQNQETNNALNNIGGALTDSSAPNTSGLENSAGWLPAGPLDSVLNLPLSLFNSLTTNLNKSCNPINIPLPYVNKNIILPCINTLYNQIGITSFLSWIGVIVSGLMLYTYLLKLYKWIEDRISLNETHNVDSWGGL